MKLDKIQIDMVNAAKQDESDLFYAIFRDYIFCTPNGEVAYFIKKDFFLNKMFRLNEEDLIKIPDDTYLNGEEQNRIDDVYLEGFVVDYGIGCKEKICKIGNKWIIGKYLRNFTCPTFKTDLKQKYSEVYIYENSNLAGLIMPYRYLDLRIKDFEEHKNDRDIII